MPFDVIIFLVFLIFGVGFITNVIKKFIELSGGNVFKERQKELNLPIDIEEEETREERLQKERDQLRYGIPTPPPSMEWVQPQPVTKRAPKDYKQAKILKEEKPAPVKSAAASAQVFEEASIQKTPPAEENRIVELLKDKDPVTQGILMSIILNPPKSLRRHKR